MSYATTKCPECGKESAHAINEKNVDKFFKGKTTCAACNYEYENFPNVSLSIPAKRNDSVQVSHD